MMLELTCTNDRLVVLVCSFSIMYEGKKLCLDDNLFGLISSHIPFLCLLLQMTGKQTDGLNALTGEMMIMW